jgi:hypothetical protein
LAWGNVGTLLLKRGIEGYREERDAEPGEDSRGLLEEAVEPYGW